MTVAELQRRLRQIENQEREVELIIHVNRTTSYASSEITGMTEHPNGVDLLIYADNGEKLPYE